jgi:PAS domain S-box-containing protein
VGNTKKLRDAENELTRYRLLSQQARDIFLFVRRSDARILDCNQAAVDAYGYSSDELTTMTDYDLRMPDQIERIDQYLANADGGQAMFETVHRRKDGSTFPVEIAARSAVVDEETVVLTVIRDISERRLAEQIVASALKQALDASRQKSEFVAMMSHEIRTPMNGVIGMTDLLLLTDLDERQRGYALTVRESGEALLGLINDILDFSKIEAGKMELEVGEFDIVELVEGVAAVLTPQAHAKRLSLMSRVDPKIAPRLVGDAGRLRQVLLNLAGNAVKFTESGDVVISATLIPSRSRAPSVEFSVKDTGAGLSEEMQGRLFEPFRQGDGSASRAHGGTGLGLSISQRLVHLMGGAIRTRSEPGAGANFSFELSLPAATAPPPPPELCDARVLLVAGDAKSADILTLYLDSWSLPYEVIADSSMVLERLDRAVAEGEPFDVALIDPALPYMDGYVLANAIHLSGRFERLRLLLVTGYDEPTVSELNGDSRLVVHLLKPIRQSQLFDAIANAMPVKYSPRDSIAKPAGEGAASMRILVAEDNLTNRRLALEQLRVLGYRADSVTNGAEAVEAVAQGRYDLIFMDCMMPEMDGFAATRAIRRYESRLGRHTRIVAMTANALVSDREACLQAGMDGYLPKPVRLDALQRVLEESYSKRAPEPVARDGGEKPDSVLDIARLSGIFQDDAAAVGSFLRSALPDIAALVRALRGARSSERRGRLAHELKGVAANLGAQRLAAAATALEHDLATNVEGRPRFGGVHAAARELSDAVSAYERGIVA